MSRQSVPLSDFLAQISRGPCFPKQQLEEYLGRTSPSSRDCLTALRQGLQIYNLDCLSYKQAAVAIWLCGVRNLKDSISDSLSFFQTLMRSRLLMLIFDLDGAFSLHHVLIFLSLPLEVTIRKCLQFGMSSRLIELFRVCNSGGSKYNETLFLFELLIVKKIKKMLDEQSQRQFIGVLGDILPPIKMERIINRENAVKMKYTGFLRVEEDSCDTYQLTYKEGKLIKIPQRGTLPTWVIQAYVRTPRPIDLTAFQSANVLDVFLLMSEAEVYASSPLVQDLELLIGDEQFQMMFESFLLGQSLGTGEYKFGCISARGTIESLKKKLQSENESYRCAIVNEALGWSPQKHKK